MTQDEEHRTRELLANTIVHYGARWLKVKTLSSLSS